jgi:hypothetical protein
MALSWLEKAQASYRAQRRPDPNRSGQVRFKDQMSIRTTCGTKLVEADKHAKYDQLCQLPVLNPPLRCLPAVLTDFGGIGRELYSAIIQPHFQQLYEAEVERGRILNVGPPGIQPGIERTRNNTRYTLANNRLVSYLSTGGYLGTDRPNLRLGSRKGA